MQLFITKPFEKININIEWIEIETVVGNFVIQPEHAPMVIELKPGIKAVYELPDGNQETIEVKTGLAHITRNSVTLLLSE